MPQRVSRRTLAKTVVDLLEAPSAKPAHIAKSLAAFLIEFKMENQLDMVIKDIVYELSQRQRQVYAEVRSARELSASLQQDVAHFLRDAYGVRHVELNTQIDPELLGGVVVDTPDAQLDASVRSKLRALGQA